MRARHGIRPGLLVVVAGTLLCGSALLSGCRQEGRSSSPSTYAASGATTLELGQLLYDMLHANLVTNGSAAEVAALEGHETEFVVAVNAAFPSQVSANLFPTLDSLQPLIVDGTLHGLVADLANSLDDLRSDAGALAALASLLSAQGTSLADDPALFTLLARILSDRDLETVVSAFGEILDAHDGIDAAGMPNGEQNLLRDVQGLLSRVLAAAGAAPATNGQSALQALAAGLLEPVEIHGVPQLGAPAWVVLRDGHGNPKVAADATGALYAPFVDADGDGDADVDGDGWPTDARGQRIDLPAFGTAGLRDADGRALAAPGTTLYEYVDAKRTMLAHHVLLAGEILGKAGPACRLSPLVEAAVTRVPCDGGTPGDASDDYLGIAANDCVIDLVHGALEVGKEIDLCALVTGLAGLIRTDRAKFEDMASSLLLAVKKARAASFSSQGNRQMLDDLLPLLDDALEQHGPSTSAVRALLDAFNQEQARLKTLPAGFAKMMKFHDCGLLIPAGNGKLSAMERLLGMIARADQCGAIGSPGTMAEFYMNAMAGNQSITIFGLTFQISIGTINTLINVPMIKALLCNKITDDDVAALQDFNDTGALDAFKPIASVFSQRGETRLLVDIMLALGTHYPTAMRPNEPALVELLESGAVEKLFEAIDLMTQCQIAGRADTVADVLADTLAILVDDDRALADRQGRPAKTLLHLVLNPLDALEQRFQARGLTAERDALVSELLDVLTQSVWDDNGTPNNPADDVERIRWNGLVSGAACLLEYASQHVAADAATRRRELADLQDAAVRALTGRDVAVVLDLFAAIAASPHRQTLDGVLARLFQPQGPGDVFSALVQLACSKTQQTTGLSLAPQDSATLLGYAGRLLDPERHMLDRAVVALARMLQAESGAFFLHVARNLLDTGAAGTGRAPIQVIADTFSDISAAGGAGPMTASDLDVTLGQASAFLRDPVEGVPAILDRLAHR